MAALRRLLAESPPRDGVITPSVSHGISFAKELSAAFHAMRASLRGIRSITAAAAALNVSRSALSNLVNARSGLTVEMAVRLYRAFGVEMNALVAMQATYDVARTQRMLGNRMKVRLQRVPAELRVD